MGKKTTYFFSALIAAGVFIASCFITGFINAVFLRSLGETSTFTAATGDNAALVLTETLVVGLIIHIGAAILTVRLISGFASKQGWNTNQCYSVAAWAIIISVVVMNSILGATSGWLIYAAHIGILLHYGRKSIGEQDDMAIRAAVKRESNMNKTKDYRIILHKILGYVVFPVIAILNFSDIFAFINAKSLYSQFWFTFGILTNVVFAGLSAAAAVGLIRNKVSGVHFAFARLFAGVGLCFVTLLNAVYISSPNITNRISQLALMLIGTAVVVVFYVKNKAYLFDKQETIADSKGKQSAEIMSEKASTIESTMMSSEQRRSAIFNNQRPSEEMYGRVTSNPICTGSIADSREYLNRLRTRDNKKVYWHRRGSLNLSLYGLNDVIEDEYELYVDGRIYGIVYICPYAYNSTSAPYRMILADQFDSANYEGELERLARDRGIDVATVLEWMRNEAQRRADNQVADHLESNTKDTENTDRMSAKEQVVVCQNCGAILPADSRFCNKCGTEIANSKREVRKSEERAKSQADSRTPQQKYGAAFMTLFDKDTRTAGYKKLEELEPDLPEAGVVVGQWYAASDMDKASEHFKKAADAGIAEGYWGLATCMEHSYIPDPDIPNDTLWEDYCLKAAEGGCKDAVNELGNICSRRKCYVEALYWYQMAAFLEQQNASISIKGVTSRWIAEGKPEEYKAGTKNLTKDRFETASIILKIYTGESAEAFSHRLMQLALAGENLAGFFVASIFEQNNNKEMAFRVYNALAFDNHPHALRCYADCKMTGTGTDREVDTALEYYEKSASAGEPASMFVMAQHALRENDKSMAAYWAGCAYTRGYTAATAIFDKIK